MVNGNEPRVQLLDGEPASYIREDGRLGELPAGTIVLRDEADREHLYGLWHTRPRGGVRCCLARNVPARRRGNYQAETRRAMEDALNDSGLPLDAMMLNETHNKIIDRWCR